MDNIQNNPEMFQCLNYINNDQKIQEKELEFDNEKSIDIREIVEVQKEFRRRLKKK